METVEMRCNEETDVATIGQSLASLNQHCSAIRIRMMESTEFCRSTKSNLQVLNAKIEALSVAKNDTIRIRDDLITRNKINAINLESLFQTQNELCNYKCEVKTVYMAAEEAMKYKKLKFNSTVASYRSKWETTEREYQNLPAANELTDIQIGNVSVNKKITELERLFEKTENDYREQFHSLRSHLKSKILVFIKEFQVYTRMIHLKQEEKSKNIQMEKLLRELRGLKSSKNENNYSVSVFKGTMLPLNVENTAKQQKCSNSYPEVDLAAFDNLILPLDSLEAQTEEDPFLYSKNEANVGTSRSSDTDVELCCENSASSKLEVQKRNSPNIPIQNGDSGINLISNEEATQKEGGRENREEHLSQYFDDRISTDIQEAECWVLNESKIKSKDIAEMNNATKAMQNRMPTRNQSSDSCKRSGNTSANRTSNEGSEFYKRKVRSKEINQNKRDFGGSLTKRTKITADGNEISNKSKSSNTLETKHAINCTQTADEDNANVPPEVPSLNTAIANVFEQGSEENTEKNMEDEGASNFSFFFNDTNLTKKAGSSTIFNLF